MLVTLSGNLIRLCSFKGGGGNSYEALLIHRMICFLYLAKRQVSVICERRMCIKKHFKVSFFLSLSKIEHSFANLIMPIKENK